MAQQKRREDIVRKLKQYRAQRQCNLYPREDQKCCKDCTMLEECIRAQNERDFIHKLEDVKKTEEIKKRREQKQSTEDFQDDEKDYICDPFQFSCPQKDECDGVNCLYDFE